MAYLAEVPAGVNMTTVFNTSWSILASSKPQSKKRSDRYRLGVGDVGDFGDSDDAADFSSSMTLLLVRNSPTPNFDASH